MKLNNSVLKTISCLLSFFIFFGIFTCAGFAAFAAEKTAADYTYKITPILEPFNEYFFIETDNPDPHSFRFSDKESVYSENANISFDEDTFYNTINLYADIKYEDKETGRVDGGYIFKSSDTDGGKVTLQYSSGSSYYYNKDWNDTELEFELPVLKDEADYLIDTYADKSDFFDNMNSVQKGFESICLYSGSFIRGEIEKTDDYWFVAIAGHMDQSFYMYSPYSRKDNVKLFASSVYPFRYDSLGFPGMMGRVATRLNKDASYEWSSTSHYLINVTCNGETKSYGGAGKDEGQGISEDKISQYFSFGKNATVLTLSGIKDLLVSYSKLEMTDDIPREGALSWKDICDKVGSEGAWVRISGSNSKTNNKWNLSNSVYTFMYKANNGDNFNDSEWGTGYRLYYGGDMRSFSDAWVDGRYINPARYFSFGEKFEAHPTSGVFVRDVTIPQISYHYESVYDEDDKTYRYEYVIDDIVEKQKDVLFKYDEKKNIWKASDSAFDDNCLITYQIEESVENAKLERKYLNMLTMTLDDIKKLNVDSNTNIYPESGYIFDGNNAPGTEFKLTTMTNDNTSIIISPSECTYNGNVQKPDVIVKLNDTVLKENNDYELSFSDNIKAGKAAVMIKGIGEYKGTFKKDFAINKADIKNADISGIIDKEYNGQQIEQKLTLKLDGNILFNGEDYNVSYSDNINVGTATVTIRGINNYDGEISRTFNISKSEPTEKSTSEAVSPTEKPSDNTIETNPASESTSPASEPAETTVNPAETTSTEPNKYSEEPSEKPTEVSFTEPYTDNAEITEKIIKSANPIKVTVKAKTVKLKKLKKKAQKVKAITVKNAQGKVTYKLVKKGITKKIRRLVKINSKGVITIKKWKKAKKATYKIKVTITAAGNANYNSKTITKTVKIKVK